MRAIYYVLLTFFLILLIHNSFALLPDNTKTNVMCYGINKKKIIQKWATVSGGKYKKFPGSWNNDALLYIRKNFFQLNEEISKDDVKAVCQETLGNDRDYAIYFFATDVLFGYQYPIIDKFDNISESYDYLDYAFLKHLIEASSYVSDVSKSREREDNEFQSAEYIPSGYHLLKKHQYKNSNLTAAAFRHDNESHMIIAYHDTSNAIHSVWKYQYKFIDFVGTQNFQSTIKDAISFYESAKEEFNESSPIILTGYGIGGYVSMYIAMITGSPGRVFGAPANYVVDKKSDFFSQTIRLPNVINFVVKGDPVIVGLGRNLDNMVSFTPHFSFIPGQHDSLKILSKLINEKQLPSSVYISADTDPGFGLKFRVHHYGDALISQQRKVNPYFEQNEAL